MALASYDVGVQDPEDETQFDYSHLLTPAHKEAGFGLYVGDDGDSMESILTYDGEVAGHVRGREDSGALSIHDVRLHDPSHRGQGLGRRM